MKLLVHAVCWAPVPELVQPRICSHRVSSPTQRAHRAAMLRGFCDKRDTRASTERRRENGRRPRSQVSLIVAPLKELFRRSTSQSARITALTRARNVFGNKCFS